VITTIVITTIFMKTKTLGGIVRIDPHIFGGQIGGKESHAVRASSKLNANIANWLRKIAVSTLLVKFETHSVGTHFLAAYKNLNVRRIECYS
jgi:hypothetical protein